MHVFSSFVLPVETQDAKNIQVTIVKNLKLLRCPKTKRSRFGLRKKWKFSRFPSFRFFPIPKKNSDISEICLFFQVLTVVITQDLKTTKIWTERKTERFRYELKEKIKISKIFDFDLYPRCKTRKSRKFYLPRILTLVVTQDLKTPKKWAETKTEKFRNWFRTKTKISEISEFSISPNTQNRKLGNLGKFCFVWLFITLLNVVALE